MDEHFFLAGRTYKQPSRPVTDELLTRFERERGLALPAVYVDLLRIQNGGLVRKPLYVQEEGGDSEQFWLEELAGIGEERNDGMDLLKVISLEDEEGQDISTAVLPIYYMANSYIALDYRQSGPSGSPSVVNVDVLEPPTLIREIAGDFETFVDGLQRNESAYFLGLLDSENGESELVDRLQEMLKVEVQTAGTPEKPECRFHHPKWRLAENVDLVPNVDYAFENEEGTILNRAAGLYFPEFPECLWMLRCWLSYQRMLKLLKRLERHGFNFIVMHEPRPDDRVRVVSLKINGKEVPLKSLPPTIYEAGEYSIEFPQDFGYDCTIRLTDANTGAITNMFFGEYIKATITATGELQLNDQTLGMLKPGDHIRVLDMESAYVNEELRKV